MRDVNIPDSQPAASEKQLADQLNPVEQKPKESTD